MEWQELAALGIVGLAAFLLVRPLLKNGRTAAPKQAGAVALARPGQPRKAQSFFARARASARRSS